MFDFVSDPAAWASLATLTLMEVVLGIDNIIFITILASRLPPEERKQARFYGLALAAVTRVLLLLGISWLVGLTKPFFTLFEHPFAGRDLILLGGGLFLVYKATKEIHHKLEGPDEAEAASHGTATLFGTIIQIGLLDIVFSFDSVITAVGMTEYIMVMVIAVLIALAIMVAVGGPIGDFVMRHPTVKMLALSFLLLIGVSLAAEAFHQGIPKGYIYSAMLFSLFVEMLNFWMRKRRTGRGTAEPEPVHLRRNVVGVSVQSEGGMVDSSARRTK
jgi:predicted tellurium resistance membrane protein TerC